MSVTINAPAILTVLYAAHDASALRQNPSHEALILATVGSGSYLQAVTAAMMTLGGTHAPLIDTCYFLRQDHPEQSVPRFLDVRRRIPGWGNGFVKGEPDPIWADTDQALREAAPELMAKVEAVTTALHEAGKMIYPNPSCYTAVTALLLELLPEASPFLFLYARLPTWTQEFCRIYRGAP